MTQEQFIKKAIKVHGDIYDYSMTNYVNAKTKVSIICKKHGVFSQNAHSHLTGCGCPYCAVEERAEKRRDTKENFIKKANEVHNNFYSYQKVRYLNSLEKVVITCPIHGDFSQRPDLHIQGRGCPGCKFDKIANLKRSSNEEFIIKAMSIHGNKYDYSKVKYESSKKDVCIICPEHGEFLQTPGNHLSGFGCPECGKQRIIESQRMTTENFIRKAKLIHGDKYNYDKTIYNGKNNKVIITCPIHGDFEQIASYHLNGNGCQKCALEYSVSKAENEIREFISKLVSNENIVFNDRKVLNGNELDIYIPDKHIAFEYDGLYWHNEINKPDIRYHLKKTEKCEEQGIQLIHIFEDEWQYKKEICKSRISSLLGCSQEKIYARKCKIVNVQTKQEREFLTKNHIQGYVPSKYKFGLEYNGELVSIMTFGVLRKNLGSNVSDGNYELLRFCNKLNCNVIGGASKLFKHFVSIIEPDRIISYADRRWSVGNLYEKIGFTFSHTSKVNYFYVVNDTRKNRFNYRKDILINKYNCDPNESEHSFCLRNNLFRIYDCGTKLYEWIKNKVD